MRVFVLVASISEFGFKWNRIGEKFFRHHFFSSFFCIEALYSSCKTVGCRVVGACGSPHAGKVCFGWNAGCFCVWIIYL